MKKKYYWLVMGILCVCLAACAPKDKTQYYQLQYQFADQTNFHVDAKYTFIDRMEKSHQGKSFYKKEDVVNVSAAFQLRIEKSSDAMIRAYYYLSNISIHDQAGNFRLELSPLNGEITWFGETQGFENYFDQKEFERFRQLLTQPLAVVTINQQGVQQNQKDHSDVNFNFEFIKLLGKNRAIGKMVVKTFKIPPVLMTIFADEPIRLGKQWRYQGAAVPQIENWDRPLTTVMKLKAAEEKGLFITFQSEMEFTGEELTTLGKQMGITELNQVSFEESLFRVGGDVYYNALQGRPNEGRMNIEKKYGLKNGQEKWQLSEEQKYWFFLSPESK